MIKLYAFGPAFNLPDPSPFVLKIDAYMRMADIPFETVANMNNLRKSPKGKLPFIEDQGNQVADSYFIIEYLRSKYGDKLDSWLTDQQRAIAHLTTRTLDEDVYWCLVYSRWIDNDTWPIVRDNFFGGMPFPVKQLMPTIIRKGVKSSLRKQGLGRHTKAELLQMFKHSLESLSTLLGDKVFLMGDKPCSLDAAAYALLAEFILVPIENDFNQSAKGFVNLVQYCQRVNQTYYTTDRPVMETLGAR